MSFERLDKLISTAACVSRNDAKSLIRQGRVTVDGKCVKDFACRVEESAVLTVDGDIVKYKKYVYYMLNKPKGILSASNDKSRETVVDIIASKVQRNGLFPVGRLDKDTTGLLIVTDDGDFGHRVISPKSGIEKEYIADVDKPITDDDIEILANGVTLADGTKCLPAKMTVLNEEKTKVSIIITEGKYHEIKRILGVVGAGVNTLHRLRIGKLVLDCKLSDGDFRELTESELFLVIK